MDYEKELLELDCMQQIYADMFTVTNRIQAVGDQGFAPLTSRQYMAILAALHLSQGETTLMNIARKLGVSKQNVSRMMKTLEAQGLVKTAPDSEDKRAVNVMVTELGLNEMQRCSSIGVFQMEKFFHGFTLAELQMMRSFLKRLRQNLSHDASGFEEQVTNPLDDKGNHKLSPEQLNILAEFSLRRSKS